MVTLPRAVEAQRWRVARVLVRRSEGLKPEGTGLVLVRRRRLYVVTNEHIVSEARGEFGADIAFWVDFQPPISAHPASVIALVPEFDLALLRTTAKWTKDLGRAREKIGARRIGMRVFSMGYDQERIASWADQLDSEGSVDNVAGHDVERGTVNIGKVAPNASPWLLISGFTGTWGASGSPVFDEHGGLIGYVSHRWTETRQAHPALPDPLHVVRPVQLAIGILRAALAPQTPQ